MTGDSAWHWPRAIASSNEIIVSSTEKRYRAGRLLRSGPARYRFSGTLQRDALALAEDDHRQGRLNGPGAVDGLADFGRRVAIGDRIILGKIALVDDMSENSDDPVEPDITK